MAQQMPISMAIRKTEIDVARKAIAVESEVKVTATAPEAKRSMNPSRGSSPALRGTRKYECMTSIPSMPMARPIDAPKMWPKKTYGKSRHEMPKVAMTARLATRKTSAGSRRSASARGSTSLPSVEWCAKARTTRMMSTVKASGRHMSMGGEELHRKLRHGLRLADPRDRELRVLGCGGGIRSCSAGTFNKHAAAWGPSARAASNR